MRLPATAAWKADTLLAQLDRAAPTGVTVWVRIPRALGYGPREPE